MALPSVTTSATTSLPPMTLYSPWKCCVSFVMFSNLLPCQRVPQEAVAQRSGEGRLFVVRGRRVAAFGVFEEPHVLDALRLHPRGHLPCLDGSDPVVRSGCPEQYGRVVPVGFDEVVGRELADELPVLGHVRVAVFGLPGIAGAELRVPAHVQQRDTAGDGSEELRVLGEHIADQQAAVRSSGAVESMDRKSTRLNSSHVAISYAVFCLKKKN